MSETGELDRRGFIARGLAAASTMLLGGCTQDGHLVFLSTASGRDAEITTYVRDGALFLRVTADKALYLKNRTGANQFIIGVATGFDPTIAHPNFMGALEPSTLWDLYRSTDATNDVPGWSALTATDTITFGAVGVEVYVKFNGVEVLRFYQYQHMEAGKVAGLELTGTGFRDVSVDFPGDEEIFSDPSKKCFDARDFGLRTVPAVTGSITGGTNSLVLSGEHGFVVGDTVIVEIGTEAGEGARGTEGVGGHWPALDYPDKATMDADTSKETGTWGATLDDGQVYAFTVSSGNVWLKDINNQGYYSDKMNPKSLVSVVTDVSGNTLTLADNAAATATDANVYLDCLPYFALLTTTPTNSNSGSVPFNLQPAVDYTLYLPAGTYATSDLMLCGRAGYPFTDCTLQGEGVGVTTLFAPKGTMGAWFRFEFADGTTMQDFTIVGNHAPNGYGMNFEAGAATIPSGRVQMSHSDGCLIQRIAWLNGAGGGFDAGENCWGRNLTLHHDYTHEAYVGWTFQIAGGDGGGFVNCQIDTDYLIKGFETFAGTDVQFTNCGGRNCIYAVNSANGTVFKNCSATFTADAWQNIYFGFSEAIFNLNTNAFGGTGRTCTIHDCKIVQEGYIEGGDTSLRAIDIQAGYSGGVTISGGYPQCPVDDSYGGYFEAPNYTSNPNGSVGGIILSNAANTVVTGIRVVGTNRPSPGSGGNFGNIQLRGANSSVTNCIADDIPAGPTPTNNQTNAQYAASC